MLEGVEEVEALGNAKPQRPTYPQKWPEYNAAQRTEKGNFLKLLHGLCLGIVEPPQTRGRPRLSYADMVFTCAFKVYTGLSGRRFGGDLEEALAKGYMSKTPHFNSIYNAFDKPGLTPLLRELIAVTSLPLKTVEADFAVDSTGISNNRFVRWFNVKHGKELDYSDWIKLHLMSGVVTNVVTSVEISGRHEHDTNFFKPLVDSTAQNFAIKEVSADKAYSSRDNLHVVVAHGATPFIPFKSNATGETRDRRGQPVEDHVPLLQPAPPRLLDALPQALECRKHRVDDQGEVRGRDQGEERNGSNQRGAIQGAVPQHLCGASVGVRVGD